MCVLQCTTCLESLAESLLWRWVGWCVTECSLVLNECSLICHCKFTLVYWMFTDLLLNAHSFPLNNDWAVTEFAGGAALLVLNECSLICCWMLTLFHWMLTELWLNLQVGLHSSFSMNVHWFVAECSLFSTECWLNCDWICRWGCILPHSTCRRPGHCLCWSRWTARPIGHVQPLTLNVVDPKSENR
jgi:hypothetical protein